MTLTCWLSRVGSFAESKVCVQGGVWIELETLELKLNNREVLSVQIH